MELLKYGSEVKVIKPSELREEVKSRISQMTKIYTSK
ncbi:hypothetical protein [Flavobacterium taihuense]